MSAHERDGRGAVRPRTRNDHLIAIASALALSAPASGRAADWPAFGHDHGNRNFSDLTQIDRGNVARLRPAWIFQTGVTGYFQAQPVMVDGLLYISTTQNHVAALDARSGRVVWTYTHRPRTEKVFGPPSNRGVAVSGGLVFEATMDGRLIALDARTGAVAWDRVDRAGGRRHRRRVACRGGPPAARLHVCP